MFWREFAVCAVIALVCFCVVFAVTYAWVALVVGL